MSARERGGKRGQAGTAKARGRKAADASEWIDVVIGVVRDGDDFLVARRALADSFGGYDEFPGGKREGAESLEEACVREVLEETGVAVRVEKLLAVAWHDRDAKRLALTFFLCRCTGERTPSPAAAKEHQARWVARATLATLRFPPANAGVLQQLLAEGSAAP